MWGGMGSIARRDMDEIGACLLSRGHLAFADGSAVAIFVAQCAYAAAMTQCTHSLVLHVCFVHMVVDRKLFVYLVNWPRETRKLYVLYTARIIHPSWLEHIRVL